MKSVIEYYNKGQNEHRIIKIFITSNRNIEEWNVSVKKIGSIGFYEWLINEKYGVLPLFKVSVANLLSDKKLYTFKQPEEIIKILAEGIK